ncbi:MAG: RNA-directed DNA polymerase [Oleiphilaceae bacterium]|jgi:RNA-directed DNA polymerase
MLFSAPRGNKFLHSIAFQTEIEFLIGISGFKLNDKKRIAANHTISLNGYVISANPSNDCYGHIKVSNKKTSKIEKALYELKNESTPIDIMKKIFGFKISVRYFKFLPPESDFVEQYCRDQLFNKLVGYRAYLISLIKYSEKNGGFEEYKIKKYTCIIASINKYIQQSN